MIRKIGPILLLTSLCGCLLFSPGGTDRRWGLIAEGGVRPDGVVVVPPFCYAGSGLLDGEEPVLIETLLAQVTVEGFNEGIVGGSTRSAEDEFYAAQTLESRSERSRSDVASGPALQLFSDDLLQHVLIEAEVSDQLFELLILVFQLP